MLDVPSSSEDTVLQDQFNQDLASALVETLDTVNDNDANIVALRASILTALNEPDFASFQTKLILELS